MTCTYNKTIILYHAPTILPSVNCPFSLEFQTTPVALPTTFQHHLTRAIIPCKYDWHMTRTFYETIILYHAPTILPSVNCAFSLEYVSTPVVLLSHVTAPLVQNTRLLPSYYLLCFYHHLTRARIPCKYDQHMTCTYYKTTILTTMRLLYYHHLTAPLVQNTRLLPSYYLLCFYHHLTRAIIPSVPQPSSLPACPPAIRSGGKSFTHPQSFLPQPSSSLGHGNTSYLHHQAGPPPPTHTAMQVVMPSATITLQQLSNRKGHHSRKNRTVTRTAAGSTHNTTPKTTNTTTPKTTINEG